MKPWDALLHGALLLLLALLGRLACAASVAPSPQASRALPQISQCLLLSPSKHAYPQLDDAFSTLGYRVRYCTTPQGLSHCRGAHDCCVLPNAEAARLTRAQVARMLRLVKSGLPLITDGDSAISRALGLSYVKQTVTLSAYHWVRRPIEPICLTSASTFTRFVAPPGATVLAYGAAATDPLVVTGKVGAGIFFYSGLPLDTGTTPLYASLPYILHDVVDLCGLQPLLTAAAPDYYLDWGFQYAESPESVAAQLADAAVTGVHFSAWYDSPAYQDFARRFIAAAHQRGIAVYCWCEFPMVGETFWRQHPEWREITAAGTEAHLDWRYLMALEDPDCLHAVQALLRATLAAFDWDGVTLAELYYESPEPAVTSPEKFTPMHPSFRHAFQARFGIDPLDILHADSPSYWRKRPDLLQQLLAYRASVLNDIMASMLRELVALRPQHPDLALVVSQIDTCLDTTMCERLGIDLPGLCALRQQCPFLLSLEDPYTTWHLGPQRFATMGRLLRARLCATEPFVITFNIVDRWQGAPLSKPSGLELFAQLRQALLYSDSVFFYAWNTVSPEDRALLPQVMAADTTCTTEAGVLRYTAKRPLLAHLRLDGDLPVLDGIPWPCWREDAVLLPAGPHALSASASPSGLPALHVEACSGQLVSAHYLPTGVQLSYASRTRCYLRLSRAPTCLRIDGREHMLAPGGAADGTTLVCPSGAHTIEVE